MQQQPQMVSQEMQMQQQQQMQMQMQHQQQMQQQQQQQNQQLPPMPMPVIRKSKFGNIDMESKIFKYTLLVVLLFIILNSKIIWKQISRLPFMGQMEPSIVALVVNSILAGIIFYMIVNFILK